MSPPFLHMHVNCKHTHKYTIITEKLPIKINESITPSLFYSSTFNLKLKKILFVQDFIHTMLTHQTLNKSHFIIQLEIGNVNSH